MEFSGCVDAELNPLKLHGGNVFDRLPFFFSPSHRGVSESNARWATGRRKCPAAGDGCSNSDSSDAGEKFSP
jgi:hypothetical protein